MNPIQPRLIQTGLFFLFIFLSGFWLNRSGAPYSTAVLTIHKLIALAAFVFLAFAAYRHHQALPFSALELAALALTTLLFIGTILTGGLLSMNKPMPAAVSLLHQITPVLTVLATALSLTLLLNKQPAI